MKTSITSLARSAVELLFPARCVACGAEGSLLCVACESVSTRLEPGDLCRKCALPSRSEICEACFSNPPALDRTLAVFQYDGPIRDAALALKYDDLRAIGPQLGDLMAGALPIRAPDRTDAVVPVPVSAKRLRSRGYNQATLLAKRVARAIDRPLTESLLRRTRDTSPQVRAMSEADRRANVDGAFETLGNVDGMRILLIDDVMTTGATLNACATELKRAGAAQVSALVLCREL